MTPEQLREVAHARLYPSLTNPNYLVLRSRRLIFTDWLKKFPEGGSVLDIGGRYQPYRPLLNGKAKRYVALDLDKTALVDVVGSGEDVPFKDESFDLVIATCVFEYFSNPHQAARNIHRVLVPGGSLLMSIPSVAPRFGDDACYHYMPRGLRSVLSPFAKVTVVPEVFSLGGLCRLMNLGFHDFLKLKPLKMAYSVTVCPVLNLIGLTLENAKLTANDKWAGNYSVMAIK
jgi:SAM-dependent methyltransferase